MTGLSGLSGLTALTGQAEEAEPEAALLAEDGTELLA